MGIGLLLGVILSVGWVTLTNRMRPAPLVIQPPPPTAEPTPQPTLAPITVYVNGSVVNPGLYELPPESRVEKAVMVAGGFTDDAFEEGINMAALLFDGAQVFVGNESDSQTTTQQNNLLSNTVQGNGVGGSGDSASGVININDATLEALDQLPGVGPSTAQKIVDYREDNGDFGQIEDIMNVSGIGEKTFEDMRDLITVGP